MAQEAHGYQRNPFPGKGRPDQRSRGRRLLVRPTWRQSTPRDRRRGRGPSTFGCGRDTRNPHSADNIHNGLLVPPLVKRPPSTRLVASFGAPCTDGTGYHLPPIVWEMRRERPQSHLHNPVLGPGARACLLLGRWCLASDDGGRAGRRRALRKKVVTVLDSVLCGMGDHRGPGLVSADHGRPFQFGSEDDLPARVGRYHAMAVRRRPKSHRETRAGRRYGCASGFRRAFAQFTPVR